MKKLLYIAPFDDTNSVNGGYSKVAREFKRIFDTIQSEEYSITFEAITSFVKRTESYNDFDSVILLMHPSEVIQHYGFIFHMLKDIKERYLHIFWETDPLPISWKYLFTTEKFTGFIASSKFNYDLIKKETSKQVYLLPVPINENDYKDFKIDIEEKKKEETFRVLYIGQYTKRKGMEDAIISFIQTLGNREDCELVLKYYPLSNFEIPAEQMIHYVVNTNIKKQNLKAKVYTLQEDLSKERLYKLYQDSSVLLFPSRGEGFGLPVSESCILGLPCIHSYGSSLKEFDFCNTYPIACIQDAAYGMAQYDYQATSIYDVPLISSMNLNLFHCYNFWKKERKGYYQYVEDNTNKIIEHFGTNKSIKIFKEFLSEK